MVDKDPVVSQSIMSLDDGFVSLTTFDYDRPYQKVVEPSDLFRLGLLLTPTAKFSASFYDDDAEKLSSAAHPMCTPPNMILKGNGSSGYGRTVMIGFSLGRFEMYTGYKWKINGPQLRACLNLTNYHIDTSLRRLALEIESPRLGSNSMIEGLITSMIVDLCRYLDNGFCSPENDQSSWARQLALIDEYIYRDGVSASIANLANLCGLSTRQLIRLFKGNTGKTVREYVEKVRLERAMRMLEETSLPLKEISYRVGFAFPSNFSIAFRRFTGSSPKAFRQSSQWS